MAQIPRAAIDYLTRQISACSADAQAKALKLLEKIDWSDVAAAREAVVEAVNILVREYGLASAQAAADFYDASRELCVGEKLDAKTHTAHDPRATEGAIRAFASRIVKDGDVDGFNKAVCSRIGYEIRRDANECIAENGAADPLKPKFARVPGGGETCGFCLMLVSFGYNYNSRQSASHTHDNCDCAIVCSWDEDAAEGYDPEGMYERYNKVLDSIGGRSGIRDEWDALPEEERDAYIARHGGKQGKAFDAFLNNRVSNEIERRGAAWFRTGTPAGAAERDEFLKTATLKIKRQKQLNHIAGTRESAKVAMDRGIAPSCFTIGLDEIQDLVTELSGTGKAETSRNGSWSRKETVDAGRVIGFVETDHGRIETSSFKIHYSNAGTHAAPAYGRRGDEV